MVNQSPIPTTTIIAYWGAIVSTILAIDKLWSSWKSRPKVEITRNFTGDSEIGHEITITNISSVPLIINYWEIFYAKSRCSKIRSALFDSSIYDFEQIVIPAHSSRKLHFYNETYFPFPSSNMKNNIYLRLLIAGKRFSVLKLVYSH